MSTGVDEALAARTQELSGRTITAQEAAEIRQRLGQASVPAELLDWMLSYRLVGAEFYLDEDEDPSELGVEMQWLTPAQMISESLEAYPGISAVPVGYFPVGSCLVGSGDYYYLRVSLGGDPAIVRIPHDALNAHYQLVVDKIETVSPRLSEFIRKARIE